MENKDAYTPDEIVRFVESRERLDRAMKDFYHSYYSNEKISKSYAYTRISLVEEAIRGYEQATPKNLREKFITDEVINRVKREIESQRKKLEKGINSSFFLD